MRRKGNEEEEEALAGVSDLFSQKSVSNARLRSKSAGGGTSVAG